MPEADQRTLTMAAVWLVGQCSVFVRNREQLAAAPIPKAPSSSRRGSGPWTNSSRNHRSRRSLSSRIRSRRNGSRRNRATKRVFRRAAVSRFPCRRRRMSTSSRRRFLPHRERFHDAVRHLATVHLLPIRRSMRMLRPPASKTHRLRRQFLTQVGLSPDVFASKLASSAT
jgi:hypothetical protein